MNSSLKLIKELACCRLQQLQARELEVNEKYAKIMEFKNRIEKMESFRQDFSEQLAELKAKWDSELTAIVDAAQVQVIKLHAQVVFNTLTNLHSACYLYAQVGLKIMLTLLEYKEAKTAQ